MIFPTTLAPAAFASWASSSIELPADCFSRLPLTVTASKMARSAAVLVTIVLLVIFHSLIIMSTYFFGVNRLVFRHPDNRDRPFTSDASWMEMDSLTYPSPLRP